MSAHAAPAERLLGGRSLAAALAGVSLGTWLGAGIAAVLCAICFAAGGGLQLSSATPVEMALTLGGAALVAAALAVQEHERRPIFGITSAALLLALAAYTAASVIWSVEPSDSWVEASRTFAYAFTFAGALALVRLAPQRWASVLGGVLAAALIVSAYAIASKVFPAAIGADTPFARLRAPFGYWNAVGVTAALGVPACLWLGARRSGHGALSALAAPAATLLLTTIMLAYSRGALLALAIGCGFWFAAVPLRLRGLAVLVLGALGTVPIVAWTFSQHALSANNVVLGDRTSAGHRLGLLTIGVLVVVLAAALAVRFASSRRAPSLRARHRLGLAALVALALVPVAGAGALAASHRGFTGQISHGWNTLTNPNASVPNDPSRLTALGSVRARYWRDALNIFAAHPFGGAGAGAYPTARTRVRSDTIDVQSAHGYVVQTLADLGLIGLGLSLLLTGAWIFAATRTANPFGWRARAPDAPYTPERIGLLTLIACVVVFAVHSLIDWTWFIPGDTCIALLCAGWVAGRGPHSDAPPHARPALARVMRADPRALAAAAAVAFGLVVAWSQWQPQRSVDAANSALAALSRHDFATARANAETAASRDPVSIDPLLDLEVIDVAAGRPAAAQADLERAVRLQPANALSWERLADFELSVMHDRSRALRDLGAALYLDPQSHAAIAQYLQTLTPPPLTPTSAAGPA
jgi:hypothetical protein